jgi:hypothetical protein
MRPSCGAVLGIGAMGSGQTATRLVVYDRPDARAVGVPLLRSELAERLADELLEGGDGLWNSCEGALGLAVAKAHPGEGSKGFRARVGNSGSDGAAVGRAFRMREIQVRGSRARDDELAVVDGSVVRSAEGHEVFGGVIAFFGAKREVVHVREDRVTAAGNATFSTVPAKDRATDLGGNRLRCAA